MRFTTKEVREDARQLGLTLDSPAFEHAYTATTEVEADRRDLGEHIDRIVRMATRAGEALERGEMADRFASEIVALAHAAMDASLLSERLKQIELIAEMAQDAMRCRGVNE
jgi:hypothetical protein